MLIGFIKAIIIGLMVTIPLGPVGVMCIQKTISKGRWAGFLFGIGSSFTDFIYSIVALFSLSFVSEFLDRNRIWVILIGGIIITFFGVHLAISNPVKQFRQQNKKTLHIVPTRERFKDALQGFAMTISNPGALVMILGAFAFAGISPETATNPLAIVLMVLGVWLGAALWWYGLSFLVNLLRKHFTLRGMLILNRISGAIIFFLGIGTIVLGVREFLML